MRRPVVVTAILLVAVAVLLVALRSWFDRPAGETAISAEASVATSAEPARAPEPAVEPAAAAFSALEPAATPNPTAAQTGPVTVIMLPARVESTGPDAAAVTDAVLQSTLRALRAKPNVSVVQIGPAELAVIAPPNAGPLGADNLIYLAVTRRYEGRVVAEIREQSGGNSEYWRFGLRVLLGPVGGGSNGGRVGRNGDLRPEGDVEFLGAQYAERIAQAAERIAPDPNQPASSNTDVADARSVLLAANRSEQERMRALSELFDEEGMDGATIAAAADLATRSASAQTRWMIWSNLRMQTYEPALAQPLSYALLSDVDAKVRKEAALALAAYAGDAAVAAALEHASRTDSSSEVRLVAQMAAMDFEEQQAFMRETLLDRSLTPAERLAPRDVDGGMRRGSLDRGFFGDTTMEEALAFAEIAVAVEDPEMKARSLSDLNMTMIFAGDVEGRSGADDSKLVNALIETSRHADAGVRRAALQSLSTLVQLNGNAEARAELESVLENEPALAAGLGIATLLENIARRSSPDAPSR